MSYFSLGFIAGICFAIGVAAFTTLILWIAAEHLPEQGRLVQGWRNRQ